MFEGLLTLGPGASIPDDARATSEAMVVLEGAAAVDVEDRRYVLGPLVAIAVAPRCPRRVADPSADRPAVLHLAMAVADPEHRWINGRFAPVEQPAASVGREGSERVVRRSAAPVAEVAPRATSEDLYDARLGTRDLCGGYARFEPGARLPCHRHPGDEAITVIRGTATCIVEGRRLINLTLEPMAMVWACAGGLPDMAVGGEHPRHPATARGTR